MLLGAATLLTPLALATLVGVSTSQTPMTTLCLNHLACYYDLSLDQDHYTVYPSHLPKRSAVTCASLCLQRRPETEVVIAKLVEVDELLECGCGSLQALGNQSGIAHNFYNCHLCPDSDVEKCGSQKTSSVYQIDREGGPCERIYLNLPSTGSPTTTTTTTTTTAGRSESTPPQLLTNVTSHPPVTVPGPPSLAYRGCYNERDINETLVETMFLQGSEVDAPFCAATCLAARPSTEVFLLKLLNTGRIYCGCGSDAALPSGGSAGECGLSCGWEGEDEQPCGGWTSVSAYGRNGGTRLLSPRPLPWLLPLLLLLLLPTLLRPRLAPYL